MVSDSTCAQSTLKDQWNMVAGPGDSQTAKESERGGNDRCGERRMGLVNKNHIIV